MELVPVLSGRGPTVMKRRSSVLVAGLFAASVAGACSDQPGESSSRHAGGAGRPSSSAGAEAEPVTNAGSPMVAPSGGGAGGEAIVLPEAVPRPVLVEVPLAPSGARAVNVVFGAGVSAQRASNRIGVGIHNYAPNSSNTTPTRPQQPAVFWLKQSHSATKSKGKSRS